MFIYSLNANSTRLIMHITLKRFIKVVTFTRLIMSFASRVRQITFLTIKAPIKPILNSIAFLKLLIY